MTLVIDNVEVMIWCRDGSVCPQATPCLDLKCKHKGTKGDVIAGIHKCKRYQVTLPCLYWESAAQLDNDLSRIRANE